jgi:hypothetical protein
MSAKKTTKTQAPADAAKKAPKAKATKPAKTTLDAPAKATKLSAIDAAAKVLSENGKAMNCKEMIDAMAAKGLWTSPGGKTPHATLYAAILREINDKGAEARFEKFTLKGTGASAKTATAKAPGKKTAKKGSAKPADGTPGPKAVSELFQI